jgi:hypothetical protein
MLICQSKATHTRFTSVLDAKSVIVALLRLSGTDKQAGIAALRTVKRAIWLNIDFLLDTKEKNCYAASIRGEWTYASFTTRSFIRSMQNTVSDVMRASLRNAVPRWTMTGRRRVK